MLAVQRRQAEFCEFVRIRARATPNANDLIDEFQSGHGDDAFATVSEAIIGVIPRAVGGRHQDYGGRVRSV